jgi:hypothetical protein
MLHDIACYNDKYMKHSNSQICKTPINVNSSHAYDTKLKMMLDGIRVPQAIQPYLDSKKNIIN